MKPLNLILCIIAICVCQIAHAASCMDGYSVAAHDIHFDITVNSSTYTISALDTVQEKSVATTTFIPSEDGFCPNGYQVYTRQDNYIYPIIEDAGLCAPGKYRANGNCTDYSRGDCPIDRYNGAIINTTFIPSEDGYCQNGYVPYSRMDDYIYPLVVSSGVLCGSGQYRNASGNCTDYSQSTCPSDYYSYSLNNNTISEKTGDSCASGYTNYTTMTNCDVAPGYVCADIPTVINITWYDGETEITSNTCTYNGLITLPETPTRTGYSFGGWKLMEN